MSCFEGIMSPIALLSILTFWTCKSLPCLPANTCFQVRTGNTLSSLDLALGRSVSLLDSSTKFTCSAGLVTQQLYPGVNDCSGDPSTESEVSIITSGDGGGTVASTGAIKVAYLQGEGCPDLTDKSEECQTFMILKHRGHKHWLNANGTEKQYGDVCDNCTNYINNPSTLTIYDTVLAPVGCVKNDLGSKLFECDANGWRFTHYSTDDCTDTGTTYAQGSEDYVTDKCGYHTQWSDISGDPCTGPGDGAGCLLFYHWYWYDLDCCPINGKTCCGAPAAGPTAYTNCITTPYPTAPPTPPTPNTNAPTQSPAQSTVTNAPTKSPVQGNTPAPITSTPTTAQPTDDSGTANPSVSPTTKAPVPTSPGTAEPTAPTTGAPTDEDGTVRPTQPTTDAPTTPGTARPTDAPGSGVGKEGGGSGELEWWWWVIIIVLIVMLCCFLLCCFYFFCYKKKKTNQYFGNQDDKL